jgi:hypothetical protein
MGARPFNQVHDPNAKRLKESGGRDQRSEGQGHQTWLSSSRLVQFRLVNYHIPLWNYNVKTRWNYQKKI